MTRRRIFSSVDPKLLLTILVGIVLLGGLLASRYLVSNQIVFREKAAGPCRRPMSDPSEYYCDAGVSKYHSCIGGPCSDNPNDVCGTWGNEQNNVGNACSAPPPPPPNGPTSPPANVCDSSATTASACRGLAPGTNVGPCTCQFTTGNVCACVSNQSCTAAGGGCFTGSTCNSLGRPPVNGGAGCVSGQVCCSQVAYTATPRPPTATPTYAGARAVTATPSPTPTTAFSNSCTGTGGTCRTGTACPAGTTATGGACNPGLVCCRTNPTNTPVPPTIPVCTSIPGAFCRLSNLCNSADGYAPVTGSGCTTGSVCCRLGPTKPASPTIPVGGPPTSTPTPVPACNAPGRNSRCATTSLCNTANGGVPVPGTGCTTGTVCCNFANPTPTSLPTPTPTKFPDGHTCGKNIDCQSNDCNGGYCQLTGTLPDNYPCTSNSQCISRLCLNVGFGFKCQTTCKCDYCDQTGATGPATCSSGVKQPSRTGCASNPATCVAPTPFPTRPPTCTTVANCPAGFSCTTGQCCPSTLDSCTVVGQQKCNGNILAECAPYNASCPANLRNYWKGVGSCSIGVTTQYGWNEATGCFTAVPAGCVANSYACPNKLDFSGGCQDNGTRSACLKVLTCGVSQVDVQCPGQPRAFRSRMYTTAAGCVIPPAAGCSTAGGTCYLGASCSTMSPSRNTANNGAGCGTGSVCCGNPLVSPTPAPTVLAPTAPPGNPTTPPVFTPPPATSTPTVPTSITPPPSSLVCRQITIGNKIGAPISTANIGDTVTLTGYGATLTLTDSIDVMEFTVKRNTILLGSPIVVPATVSSTSTTSRTYKATTPWLINQDGNYTFTLRVHSPKSGWRD